MHNLDDNLLLSRKSSNKSIRFNTLPSLDLTKSITSTLPTHMNKET